MIQSLPEASPIPGVPANINNAIDFFENVQYGTGSRDQLDLYRAKSATGQTPCLVFIHGGSFVSGDKDAIRRPAFQSFLKSMLEANITVISINYELTQVPFDPEGILRAMRGMAKGLIAIKKSGTILNIDVENMIYMGSSAGGFASQWFSMKDFGIGSGVDLTPKAAISFKPNLTMNLFRIEELGLMGEDRGINDALMDQRFKERCISWFALEEPENIAAINDQAPSADNLWPYDRSHLNQEQAIKIMWSLDPVANEMFTADAKPLLLISDNALEEPDEIEEYIHNPFNVQEIIDRYVQAGAPIFAIGLDAENPTPNFPEDNPPELVAWAIDQFQA
jgi:acetyl esterase/lipase